MGNKPSFFLTLVCRSAKVGYAHHAIGTYIPRTSVGIGARTSRHTHTDPAFATV
jgi:hypothetical protein